MSSIQSFFLFFVFLLFTVIPKSFVSLDLRLFSAEFEDELEERDLNSRHKGEAINKTFFVYFDQDKGINSKRGEEKITEKKGIENIGGTKNKNEILKESHKEEAESSSHSLSPAFDRIFFSADSFDQKKEVQDAHLEAPALIGFKGDESFLASSSASLFRVSAPRYMSGLFVSNHSSQTGRRIPLFSEEMIRAFSNLLRYEIGEGISKRTGMIWGYVTDEKGQPLKEAEVELNDSGEHPPIYFSSFIPDLKRVETTKNGEFAFVNLPIGTWYVRFSYKGKYFPAQIVPVEENHISYVHLQKGEIETLFLKVQDAFNPSFIPSSVVLKTLGEEDFLNMEGGGSGVVEMRRRQGNLTWLDLDPGDAYELSRYCLNTGQMELSLPVVQKKWILDFAEKSEVHIDSKKGIVVGFADRQNYRVRTKSSFLDEQVLYFDKNGQILSPLDESEIRAGFVLFNLAQGIYEITLVEFNEGKEMALQTQLVVPDPLLVNIVRYKI